MSEFPADPRPEDTPEPTNTEAASTEIAVVTAPVPKHPTFEDFGGLEDQIQQLREVGLLFTHPWDAQHWDLDVPSGVILSGPGGVGKTELVRAFSNEFEAELVEIPPSKVMDMYVGQSNRTLKNVFEYAENRDHNVVLLFDEMDGLFSKNAGGNPGVSTSLVSEMKMLMGNLQSVQPNTIVFGTTNNPTNFDPALLRPGRFDVMIQIPAPNAHARTNILSRLILGRSDLYELGNFGSITDFENSNSNSEAIDFSELSKETEGMTGADIKAILNEARRKKFFSEIEKQIVLSPLTQHDLIKAIGTYRRSRMHATD